MREPPSPQAFDSRFDAAFQPGFEERVAGREPAASDTRDLYAELGLTEQDAQAPTAGEQLLRRPGQHDEHPPHRPLIDGFVIALWVIGGVAVLGGLLLFGMSAELSSSREFTQNYLMLIMLALAGPVLVALGLATVIGTVFLLATRWERRP